MVYERTNTPVDPGVLVNMMNRLSHRGPDGQNSWLEDHIGMGHWHFWTTPEDQGECQPLKLSALPFTIVMDGRLDNRSDLLRQLNFAPEERLCFSDAAIVLHGYAKWGVDWFKHLVGEFAFVIWDHNACELICARDAVGNRTMFYAFQGPRVLIASEPWTVAAAMNRQVEINESSIAYYFAMRQPQDGRTFFTGITELLPAHWLKIDNNSNHFDVYWQPQAITSKYNRSEEECAEELREVLDTSVQCRLRSITPPAIMMSGGLDSTSVACLAAQKLHPTRLTTVSYVFREFLECDESQYIDAVHDKYQTQSIQIPCDDLWPFKSWPEWSLDPSWPPGNPYQSIIERTYARAQKEGIKVLLTGMSGDNLYSASENYLVDLFLDGEIKRLGQEVKYLIDKYGWRKAFGLKVIRNSIKRIIHTTPGLNLLHRAPSTPNWLTPYGAGFLELKSNSRIIGKQNGLFNFRLAAGSSREIYNTSRYGLELRSPYHDRRLIEFFWGIPGHMLFSQGVTKKIIRKAMDGILPVMIQSRNDYSDLLPLFNYGLQRRGNEILEKPDVDELSWQKFVNADIVYKELHTQVTRFNDGPRKVVPSLCILFNLWYKSFVRYVQ